VRLMSKPTRYPLPRSWADWSTFADRLMHYSDDLLPLIRDQLDTEQDEAVRRRLAAANAAVTACNAAIKRAFNAFDPDLPAPRPTEKL
jgi:hypothetical protein